MSWVRATLVMGMILASVATARADSVLTAMDRSWLTANLNLPGDSPALLDLSPAQQTQLHALIADRKRGIDRQRQTIVQFLTEATDSSLDRAVTATPPSRPAPGKPTELATRPPR